MSTIRRRNSSSTNYAGGIQDPSVSTSSEGIPYTTVVRPRLGRWRSDCVGLFYPIPSTHPFSFPSYLQQESPVNDSENGNNGLSTSMALFLVIAIFLCAILALGIFYRQFPDLEENEMKHLKLPWDLEEAKQLGLILDRYKQMYFYEVLFGVFLVYIFLQTFAIPGSIFLSILSGFLFPFYLALLLVCCCSAIGASLCFFISHLLGKKLVKKFFPERARVWSIAVEKHRDNLLNYIIFLRVTPFLPNWFINLSAPVIGVPLLPFALGTFIGVAPPSFVAIQAGQTLHTLTSTSDAWSWTSMIALSIFAIVSLVPVLMKQKLQEKFE